jgi:hypothetical protein
MDPEKNLSEMSVILKETDKNSLFGRLIIGRNVVVCQGKVITIYGGLGLCGCVWACIRMPMPGKYISSTIDRPASRKHRIAGGSGRSSPGP